MVSEGFGGLRHYGRWATVSGTLVCMFLAPYFCSSWFRDVLDRDVSLLTARVVEWVASGFTAKGHVHRSGVVFFTDEWYLRVVRKCTGYDALAITYAFVLGSSTRRTAKLVGLILGTVLVLGLNIMRITTIVIAAGTSTAMAMALDDLVWPILYVGVWVVVGYEWYRRFKGSGAAVGYLVREGPRIQRQPV